MMSDVPRQVRLSPEEYDLWRRIKKLAEGRQDVSGAFPMTYREVSELSEQEGYGATLIAPLEKAGVIIKVGKRFLQEAETAPDRCGGRVSSIWKLRSYCKTLDSGGPDA